LVSMAYSCRVSHNRPASRITKNKEGNCYLKNDAIFWRFNVTVIK
jgi:hypothetical protein